METIDTLAPLAAALERFRCEARTFDGELLDRIPHSLRGRVGELVADVADGVEYQLLPAVAGLLAEQDRVSRVLERQLAPLLASSRPLPEQVEGESEAPFTAPGSHERMRLAFKLLFITVRSLQNALNVSSLWLMHNTWPRYEKQSMEFAVNHPESDIGRLVARVPGYTTWFAAWRAQRNRVKDGTGFGSFALDGDVGIHFTALTDENVFVVDCSTSRVGLRDVTEALDQSCTLMQSVRKLAEEP